MSETPTEPETFSFPGQPDRPPHRPRSGAGFMRGMLIFAAIFAFLGGIAIAILLLTQARGLSTSQPGDIALFVLPPLIAGIVSAALLLGLSKLIGQLARPAQNTSADDVRPSLDRLESSLRILNTIHSKTNDVVTIPASTPALGHNGGMGPNLAPILETLRDLTLMSDAQRQRFAHRHWLRRREILTEIIERNVLVGDWPAAFTRLEDLQLLLPDDPQVAELKERVEFEQAARLEEDMRVARSRFGHLVSIAAWPQAEALAADLQRKYPGKPEPTQLAEDVGRAREAFERENAERLFREISTATDRRQWKVAINALEEFVRHYPSDPRAHSLRLDLPMLQENAAAQDRKEQEESFKDLLKRQRYEEAIAVARAVIQKYPNSATATELTKLLPRVEDLRRQAATASQVAIAGAFVQPNAPTGHGQPIPPVRAET